MNRLIIVGNGFDLSLGLKTSYNDFLRSYLISKIKEISEPKLYRRIKSEKRVGNFRYNFNDLVSIKIWEHTNLSYILKELKDIKSYRKVFVYINEKYGEIKFNYGLLEKIHDFIFSNNWVDIEIVYYDELLKLYNGIKELPDREKSLIEFHRKFDLFKGEFIDYLNTIKLKGNNIDFFSSIYDRFIESKGDFFSNDKLMLLNFNYTPFVDKFRDSYGFSLDQCEIVNIHGSLMNTGSVIFGFGDELDKNYKTIETERSQELFRNIKSVHYFKYSTYNRLVSFMSKKNFQVYIYGHSCGVSDRTLLNEIFEHENCSSVRIFYYKTDNEDNFHDISVGVIRQFTDKVRMRHIVKSKGVEDIISQRKQK